MSDTRNFVYGSNASYMVHPVTGDKIYNRVPQVM